MKAACSTRENPQQRLLEVGIIRVHLPFIYIKEYLIYPDKLEKLVAKMMHFIRPMVVAVP